MLKQKMFHITLSKDFENVFNIFQELVERDEVFLSAVKEKEKKDKRYRKGRRESSKIRYAIAYYIKHRKLELAQREEEQVKAKKDTLSNYLETQGTDESSNIEEGNQLPADNIQNEN